MNKELRLTLSLNPGSVPGEIVPWLPCTWIKIGKRKGVIRTIFFSTWNVSFSYNYKAFFVVVVVVVVGLSGKRVDEVGEIAHGYFLIIIIVGAGDSSTFLGYGPCSRMIKDLMMIKIHVHIDRKTEEKRETSAWTEDPEVQRYLGNTLGNPPYWKEEFQGR